MLVSLSSAAPAADFNDTEIRKFRSNGGHTEAPLVYPKGYQTKYFLNRHTPTHTSTKYTICKME